MCIECIADLILHHISPDPTLFGMRQVNEASDTPVELDERHGYADVVRIADLEALREILLNCGGPDSGKWILIRSLVTMRAVFFGYNGQAFACLPNAAAPIVSPDNALVMVEECSHMLTETDWMDGLAQS